MRNNFTKFTDQFAGFRKRCGLSYRSLEAVTGIKYSALAAMQTGNRPVGEQSARRIAAAFGLSDEAREAFVLSALNTSKEKVLASVGAYPAEALNLVGLLLMAHGIKANQITTCDLDSLTPEGLKHGLHLSLEGGRKARLQVVLLWEA